MDLLAAPRRPVTVAPPAASPADGRLWWVDAVRAAALAVVIIGHYLIALVHLPDGGELTIGPGTASLAALGVGRCSTKRPGRTRSPGQHR